MAALYATNITNAIIKMDSFEPPILDGSSKIFIDAINNIVIKKKSKNIYHITFSKKITFDIPYKNI